MRLIDADALIAKFKDDLESLQEFAFQLATIGAINTVKHQPTVDAVPVVRCKDCKHMGDVYLVSLPWLEQKEQRCRLWEHPTTPDDYCSRAERNEE